METRARYVLVGAFTLLVMAAAFTFVYWLNATGGLEQRTLYRIRYQNSVAGLQIGSVVLFNGVRVGEVTSLDLDPAAPLEVLATIAVATTTPVRQDTKAGLDFQGLTGSTVVSLKGGTPALAFPAEAEPPLLVADPDAGQSMSEAARDALRRFDAILSDNADPLHSTMTNLSKFTDALARNADRVDAIVAWLDRLSGAAKAQSSTYDLAAASKFPAFEKPQNVQIVFPEPVVTFALSQDKILARDGDNLNPLPGEPRWSDMLANLLLTRIIQSFENAGFLGQVSRPTEGVTADYQVAVDIRNFEIESEPELAAVVELSAKLLSTDGHQRGAHMFRASVPIAAKDGPSAAAGLSAAFAKAAAELVVWAAGEIPATSDNGGSQAP